jgi:N-acetyl-gamma-glutamyl-phosphate reductase
VRERWYPDTRRVPEHVAYGLTERERDSIRGARLVANPGCYPTAALLALAPLAFDGLLLPGTDIVVDAKSGVSGAGRTPNVRTHFSECHGSLSAYGVFDHRHAAEIEQGIAGSHALTFVPHLVPLDRGMLATIYVRLAARRTLEQIVGLYRDFYAAAPLVRVYGDGALPEIQAVAHTNYFDVGFALEAATDRLIIISALDNLGKGAAGQAVQNMNLMYGFDEVTALV